MKIITTQTLDDLLAKAGSVPRKRSNYNIHESGHDAIQRYLIGAKIDSYFRPHRHPKFELAFILRGRFDLLLFDDNALVTDRISLGPATENAGFELPPNVWHTWIPMEDDSIFLEVKEGPYDPSGDVEFAGWSPPEGDGRVPNFLATLKRITVGADGNAET